MTAVTNPGPSIDQTPNIGGGPYAAWANSAGTALIGPTGSNVPLGGGGVAISAGTQSVSSGTLSFANSNNVTFGMSGSNQITASFSTNVGLQAVYDGANSISSGSLSLVGNNATWSVNGQTLSLSVGAGSSLVFSNSNNVSFGTAGSTLTASASFAQTNQTAGFYAIGNTTNASSTTFDARTISVNGLGAITAGYSVGSGLLISAPATSSLVGQNGFSVSTNGSTISLFSTPVSRLDFWPVGGITSGQQTNTSASFRYIQMAQPVSFSRVDIPVLMSIGSAVTVATADMNISSGLVIYSRNGSTLSPITGVFGTTTYTWASNSANWSNLTGGRNMSFPINGSLSAGEYWIGFQLSTTNNSSLGLSTTILGNTISILQALSFSASQIQDMGTTNNSSQNIITQGCWSSSISATNQTINMSVITATGTAGQAANFPVIFRNY